MGLLRGFSIAMGANMMMFVLSFLTNKLLYLFLSPEQNGTYFLVMRSSMLISVVFGEWLRLSNINLAGQNKERSKTLIVNMVVYSVVVALVLFLSVYLLPHNSFFTGIPLALTGIVIVIGCAFIIRDGSQSLFLVNNHMVTYGFIQILTGGTLCLLTLILLPITQQGLNGAIAALVISMVIAAIWALVECFRSFGISLIPSLTLFGKSLKYGIRSAIAVLGTFLMLNIQTFSLEPLARNPAEGLIMVGMFSVCFRIYQLFQRVSDVTGNIVIAQVARNKETDTVSQTVAVHRHILTVFTGLACISLLTGKYMIYIIADTNYVEAYIPFLFIVPGIVFFNSAFVLNSFYWGRGYPLHIIVSPYVVSMIGLGLNHLLIPYYGVTGATISFSVMSVVWFLYMIITFHRQYSVSYHQLLIPQKSDMQFIYDKFVKFRMIIGK
jgi:O-antigen/teichoic acid export membrane protein